jgi:hypothetical protein
VEIPSATTLSLAQAVQKIVGSVRRTVHVVIPFATTMKTACLARMIVVSALPRMFVATKSAVNPNRVRLVLKTVEHVSNRVVVMGNVRVSRRVKPAPKTVVNAKFLAVMGLAMERKTA